MQRLVRFIPDRFTILLIVTILIASLLPAHGQGVVVFSWITNLAVALLFFLHGARLSRDAVIAGLTHWKLHASIFSTTLILFPILGLALKPLLEPLITPELFFCAACRPPYSQPSHSPRLHAAMYRPPCAAHRPQAY